MKKRRPEILNPGRKLQTPVEKKATALARTEDLKRWNFLLSLNKYKPTP
jgi:hypothetical protein